MGLKEDIKEMYHQLGIMDERVRQVENMTPPKKDEILKDLEKAKTEKEFDKKAKEWKGKIDKADTTLKDADAGFDSFTNQVKKVDSANYTQYQDNTKLNFIDERIKEAEDVERVLKQAGQPSPFGPVIAGWQKQRKDVIDQRKQLFDELKKETTAMWALYDAGWSKYIKVKSGDLRDAKEFLKTATFSSVHSPKGKLKPVKAR